MKIEQLVRLAELEIDPAQLDAYLELLRVEIETSLAVEPGVLMLYALQVKGQSNLLRMVEVYSDRAAYDSHLQSPHFLAYKSGTAQMVKSLHLIETEPFVLGASAV